MSWRQSMAPLAAAFYVGPYVVQGTAMHSATGLGLEFPVLSGSVTFLGAGGKLPGLGVEALVLSSHRLIGHSAS